MADIVKHIKKTSNYKELYDIPWKVMMDRNIKIQKNLKNKLRIVLICHPCYGYGDIIFALKMYHFILKWYSIECTIMTTKPLPFIENGIKKIYCLRTPGKSYLECEKLNKMKVYSIDKKGEPVKRATFKHQFDLIFVTPWIGTDFEPSKKIIRNFIPYANNFNTFLFSEYNAPDPHKYDFPTGIGKDLMGLLVTKFKFEKTVKIKNPYIMVHLTSDDRINVTKCFSNFIKLMCKKYHKTYSKLDAIIPKHVLDDPKGLDKLFRYIKEKGYYKNTLVKTEKGDVKTKDSTLTLRTDVVPLPYDQYTGLFKKCLPDVLITGDQSVTDIISCCKNYNIYYQIMPWKTNFAKNLARALGRDFIRKVSTSCGLEKFSLRMKMNLNNVAIYHSFSTLGKPKLDAVLMSALYLRKDKYLQHFVKTVFESKKKTSVLKKTLYISKS